MIASVDESVGRVAGRARRTEAGREHAGHLLQRQRRRRRLRARGHPRRRASPTTPRSRGGKGMLYEGGIRVPYIFRWPGTNHAAARRLRPADQQRGSLSRRCSNSPARRAAPSYPLDGASYLALLTSGGKTAPRPQAALLAFPRLSRRRAAARGARPRRARSATATGS